MKTNAMMTASERLQQARLDADEGRHEQALKEFIWYHHHALETEPSLYGVRLSFALGYWNQLAERYAPARLALETIADDKTRTLLDGRGDRALFHDVMAIRRTLGEQTKTRDLFAALASAQPELAKLALRMALPALVATGAFALAEDVVGDPMLQVQIQAARLNESITHYDSMPSPQAHFLEAVTDNYVDAIRLWIAVCDGLGKTEQATAIKARALDAIESVPVRATVDAALA